MHNVTISVSRTVKAKVEGEELLYTPKGNRPIDPHAITINYGINPNTGKVDNVHVEVLGFPVNEEHRQAVTRHLIERDYGYLPRGWFQLDQAPAWIKEAVERFNPEKGK